MFYNISTQCNCDVFCRSYVIDSYWFMLSLTHILKCASMATRQSAPVAGKIFRWSKHNKTWTTCTIIGIYYIQNEIHSSLHTRAFFSVFNYGLSWIYPEKRRALMRPGGCESKDAALLIYGFLLERYDGLYDRLIFKIGIPIHEKMILILRLVIL